MTSQLKTLQSQGEISSLSYYFAKFIAEQCAENLDSLVALSAAMVSEANQQGHVCVEIDDFENRPLFNSDRVSSLELIKGVDTRKWCQTLLEYCCVGSVGETAPLILENNRLYLYRYWFYETQVAEAIQSRLITLDNIDFEQLSVRLETLYPSVNGQSLNEQKFAVALSIIRRFAVISGGPGTGKTTTVINILAVLLSQQADTRIALAAPTGKAAARMMESIQAGLDNSLIEDDIKALIPTDACTIHRLLGFKSDGFRYSRQHLLAVDCVVIDEASMVDLTLMYHLLDALPADARIILLGDRDQLASVAAGNVLGDITGQGRNIEYSPALVKTLSDILREPLPNIIPSENTKPIADSIALLKQSYRFTSKSGIGDLAKLVNQGNDRQVIDLLASDSAQIKWISNAVDRPEQSTFDHILTLYQAVVSSHCIESAFNAFENSRVLCAVHSGAFGDNEINLRIEESMRLRNWIDGGDIFPGKPILILANDYELRLFNGDTGLLWLDDDNRLMAFFRDSQNGLRHFPISSLPEHDSAWAMTVHKSQGSEFDAVVLILPPDGPPEAVSRELLYTGVTRARRSLTIHATTTTLEAACRTTRQRFSGLASKLKWD